MKFLYVKAPKLGWRLGYPRLQKKKDPSDMYRTGTIGWVSCGSASTPRVDWMEVSRSFLLCVSLPYLLTVQRFFFLFCHLHFLFLAVRSSYSLCPNRRHRRSSHCSLCCSGCGRRAGVGNATTAALTLSAPLHSSICLP